MSSREKRGVLIVLLSILLIFLIKGLLITGKVPECEAMRPVPVGKDGNYTSLDFADKTRISLTKYGFRKKLVIKEPSIVTQLVSGPSSSFIHFGVFEDDKLNRPVEEANFKWLYKDGDFQEGKVDEPPYDEKKDGIVILEPGVYYAAVYANNPFSGIEASYLSYASSLKENRTLREGKKAYFYFVQDNQSSTFKVIPKQRDRVKITTNIYNVGTVKVYNKTKKLLIEKKAAKDSNQSVEILLDVKKSEVYYIEISGIKTYKEEAVNLSPYTIQFNYL